MFLVGGLRRGGWLPVDFRAREEAGGFASVAVGFRFGGGGLSSSESDEIAMISSSEGLGFAAGAGNLPSLLDEALDEGWPKDLIRWDEEDRKSTR